jgi:hypothetical protein
MRRRLIVAVAIVAVILAVRFFQSPSDTPATSAMTEAEIAQIEAEVLQVWEGFFQSFRDLDMDGVTGIFHPEHTSMNYQYEFADYAAMLELYEGFFAPLEAWEGGWVDTRVRVLTPSFAVFEGRYWATIHFTDGSAFHWPENAIWTALMEKTDDGWLVAENAPSSPEGQPVEQG